MARTTNKRRFYNLIWIPLLALLLAFSLRGNERLTSLALDQEVRCGLSEHTHSDACYLDDVLLCREKAHIHSRNCFLMLLEDNDINWLLAAMGSTEDKSLEAVLDSALVQAINLNSDFTAVPPPLQLSANDIRSLNQTIEDNSIMPAVVLNENLENGTLLSYTPGNEGISTTAVGDSPVTGSRVINFYMMLDGNITFVNSTTLIDGFQDYCAGSNVVGLYRTAVVTNLQTSGLDGTYHFRYNTTGRVSKTSDFNTDARYNNSNVRFGNTSSTRYALLTNKSNTAIQFYTVKLDYSQLGTGRVPDVQYVESGCATTLSLSSNYRWYDSAGNLVTAMPTTITGTTTLYARPKTFTVSFVSGSGATVLRPQTLTPQGTSVAFTLPSLQGTDYEGYYWIVEGSDGTTYYPSDGTATVTITDNATFRAIPNTYRVVFTDETGAENIQEASYRQTITLPTLPDGYYWFAPDGTRFTSGAAYGPVIANTTFTAATKTVTVTYDVNFPWNAAGNVDRVPTIYGTTLSTVTDTVISGTEVITRTLTSRTARDEISTSNKESITYFFRGWTIEGTDVLIAPDAILLWNQLDSYAGDAEAVTLKGVWEDGDRYNSATFFVQFNSQAVDTDGNITSRPTENYTPEIFNTHVGGVDRTLSDSAMMEAYKIVDTTSDNSLTADRRIRALYGEKASGVWLYDFPKDEDVFAYLIDYLEKNPSKQLTVDGKAVDPTELDDRHYAIRWYVFKLEGSSWHIDGKLVHKYGTITVDKEFYGNETAIELAEQGFYILTENGTKDENGVFTPYPSSHKDFRQILLVLDRATANTLSGTYPNASYHVVDTEDLLNDNFEWKITDVTLGEYWRVTEYPIDLPNYSYYAEYSIYDTDGAYSAIAEYGTQASVVGKAFALDEDPDQGMLVDFANYYYEKDSILLKKEDAATGNGIDGAVFEMWQNGVALRFNYDAATGIYSQSPGGTTTKIRTDQGGIAVITDFSYLHGDSTGDGLRDGDIVIKEVSPPAGYDKAPDVELGLDGNGNVVIKSMDGIEESQWQKHASVPDNEVAVIRDYVSEYLSVEVNKAWNTSAPADSVEVVLQANGVNAAALLPGMTNVQVTLNAANQWSHTWTNLPRYANGKPITWGVKEVVIGGMPTLSDGVSFANWIVTYSPGQGTDADGDGDIDRWSFTITNATRRPQLIITKVDLFGAVLPGAEFELEQVTLANGSFQPVAGTAVTMTTNAGGLLTFDQLMAGAYYRLTETKNPEGYFGKVESVIITIDGEGVIQQVNPDGSFTEVDHAYVSYTRPYNLQVLNLQYTILPETGGAGTMAYTQLGYLLIALGTGIYGHRRKRLRRKEGSDSS